MIIFRLIKESLLFAVDSLIVNKLRTILSLLGITIGIFAMISVFTMVDSLERTIKDSINSLGDDVIYVQKMPWNFDPEQPWWDYIRRPQPDLDDFRLVKKMVRNAEGVAMLSGGRGTMKYRNSSINSAQTLGVTHAYEKLGNLKIEQGRYFTELESESGRPVAIIGAAIASNLFPPGQALGKEFKFKGRKLTVIGIMEKEGESMLGETNDNRFFIPLKMARNLYKIDGGSARPTIMVKAKEGVSNRQLIDELTGIMRSIRKLKPKAENNFALNQMSMLSQGVEAMFGVINLAGFVIGIFSIIVGGFSIANIMFVSVKERTSLIGIQKALGAKNYFILFQFLFESIFLCIIGGGVGLLLIFLGTLLLTYGFDFEVTMGLNNVGLGLLISIIIGLVSGIVPSWSASRLDPVEAIRS
ncbi:MAG: ABC transporter permease [Vicingaceae bacterium]